MLKRKIGTYILKKPSKKFKQKLPVSPPKSDFPTDVLKWMKKNAAPKMALKLMQICKYFQHQKFPYFVADGLFKIFEYLKLLENSNESDLNNLERKLWITKKFHLYFETSMEQLFANIAYCDIKSLNLTDDTTITFENYKILTAAGNVERMELQCPITKEGENVPLENILERVPKLDFLKLSTVANSFKSYEKAIEVLPMDLKYLFFDVYAGIYDFEILFAIIQNNQKIKFRLTQITPMNNTERIMPTTINGLQSHVDNLLKAWSPVNNPPDISFMGQSLQSEMELRKLQRQFRKQKYRINKNKLNKN